MISYCTIEEYRNAIDTDFVNASYATTDGEYIPSGVVLVLPCSLSVCGADKWQVIPLVLRPIGHMDNYIGLNDAIRLWSGFVTKVVDSVGSPVYSISF